MRYADIFIEMKNILVKAKIHLALTTGILVGSNSAVAYDKDTHYYVMSMILADLDRTGSPMVEKKLLAAMANQYTDDNPNTLPSLNPIKAQQRRNWHFPAKMDWGLIVNTYGVTKRNSEFAKHNVNKGLETNDPYALGMSLHTYMDSFAHEGYEAYFGHATAGHNPDRVHLDINKFRETVWMTYSIVRKWYENNGLQVNTSPISMDKYMEWAQFVPAAYSCTFCSYDDEIEQRSDYWYGLATQSFPEISLPKYAITEQCFIDKFEAAAKNHNTPVRSEDAWGIEWYTGSFDNLFKATSFLSEDLVNAAAANCPTVTDPSDPFDGLNRKQAAALALDSPDSVYNGLPAILSTRAGINALFKAANQRENGWETLYLASSSAHNRGINWSRFKSQIRVNLSASKLERQLFGIGTLSILNDTAPSTCKKINRLYSKIDSSALTERQVSFLVNTISPSPAYISECATESLPLLQALLNDVRVSGLAAARLYQITSAEGTSTAGVSASSLSSHQANASDAIRLQSRDVLNTVNPARQPQVLAQAAVASMNSEIEYWSARALQDFSDAQRGTEDDQVALVELERRLQGALNAKNLSLASGIASSIGTFTANDHPSDALISLLTLAVSNPEYQSINMELEYALHQLAATN